HWTGKLGSGGGYGGKSQKAGDSSRERSRFPRASRQAATHPVASPARYSASAKLSAAIGCPGLPRRAARNSTAAAVGGSGTRPAAIAAQARHRADGWGLVAPRPRARSASDSHSPRTISSASSQADSNGS